VRLAQDFVRMRVTTASEQADLMARIDDCLSTVESQAAKRTGWRGRRGGSPGRGSRPPA
jgi:hypothetical protein